MSEPKASSSPTSTDTPSDPRQSTDGSATVKSRSSAASERAPRELRLVALDAVDLTIIAANLQDAVGRVRDMAFVPRDRRFVMLLNRFDWIGTQPSEPDALVKEPAAEVFKRRRCALRFEHVRSAKVTGFAQTDKKLVLSLLTIGFEQAREGDPDGYLTLMFAGGGAIRLEVECIEAELTDIGMGWRTNAKPEHPEY